MDVERRRRAGPREHGATGKHPSQERGGGRGPLRFNELGGALPIKTHGGQLGEAYLHGMNGIAEGVRLCAAPRSTRYPTWSTWW
jgi:hypothetical protein